MTDRSAPPELLGFRNAFPAMNGQSVKVVFLLFLFPPCFSAFAQDRIVQITNGAALPGNPTTIELRLSNPEGFAGGDFELQYDPSVITVEDINRSPLTDDFLLVDGAPSAGRLSISMAAGEGLASTDPAAIAVISLLTASAAPVGTETAITLRTARWYDELSARHEFLGDNALFAVGDSIPPEEALALSVGSAQGAPGEEVTCVLSLSCGEAVARIGGTILFDSAALLNPVLEAGATLGGWNQSMTPGNGQIEFLFSDNMELQGTGSLEVARFTAQIAPTASPGGQIEVSLDSVEIQNSDGFGFQVVGTAGAVSVTGDISPTPTPTPTQQTGSTPTPCPTWKADYDGNGRVDENDLLRLLQSWHQEATHK